MAVRLSELMGSYPDQDDPLFAGKITVKTEFAELALGKDQPKTKPGELFPSQIYCERILAPESTVDEQILIHGVGVGKTCAATAVAESYKHNRIGVGKKKALVVVKGDTVEQSFRDTLTYVCTKGEYVPPKDISLVGQRSVNTKQIHNFYTIAHYQKLASDISLMSDAEIRDEYSDRVIIFDEAHHLRMGYSSSRSKEEKEMQRLQVYRQIHRMLHLVQRRKIILLTASPAPDRPKEFGLLINLLLPLHFQIPDDYDWEHPSAEDLEPYFRGLISYVQGSSNVARMIEMGEDIPEFRFNLPFKILVYAGEMSEEQGMQYLRYAPRGGSLLPSPLENVDDMGEDAGDADRVASVFRIDERYASMFIFPRKRDEQADVNRILDNPRLTDEQKQKQIDTIDRRRDAIGASAIDYWLVRTKKDKDYSFRNDPGRDLRLYLRRPAPDSDEPDQLPFLSIKYYNIFEEIWENPRELAFIYTEFVQPPGAELLGLIFQARGFTPFDGSPFYVSGSAPVSTGSPKQDSDLADARVDDPVKVAGRQVRLRPARRYAIITSRSSASYIKNALEAFRSYENRYGDYLQVVIGSNVTREGLSYRNVRQVHNANPFWNDVPVYQSIGRAFRENAHDDLLPEERYVKVYKHASILDSSYGKDQWNTVDIDMYIRAETKRYLIAQVMRIAKRSATDCALHKVRNQDRGEEDGSRNCDYTTCKYTCIGSEVDAEGNPLPQLPPDDSTYFLYYSQEVVSRVKDQVKRLLQTNVGLTLSDIVANTEVDTKYVLKALNEVIQGQEVVNTEFGTPSYVKEVSNYYFLQLDMNTPEKALSSYSHRLVAKNPISLSEFLAPYRKSSEVRAVEELSSQEFDFDDIVSRSKEVKANLVEKAILDFVDKKMTPFDESIYEVFENRWYLIDGVYVHDILTQDDTKSRGGYNATTKSSKNRDKIRILDKGVWRFVNPDEANRYFDEIIRIDDAKRDQRMKPFQVYAEIFTFDGKTRLIKGDSEGRRDRGRGQVCEQLSVSDLVDILANFDTEPPSLGNKAPSIDEMRRFLTVNTYKDGSVANWSDAEVRKKYRWTRITRGQMCDRIVSFLDENGRLFFR